MKRSVLLCAAALCTSFVAGCAVPHFDVPTTRTGQPTVQSIIARVECELRDMVRDDMGNEDVTSFHRLFLLDGDYDVELSLSLEVNDTGGLSPSVTFSTPLSALTSLAFGANATLSESRDHNFTENIQLSTRAIYSEWKANPNLYNCPVVDQSLSGTLGLKDFVAMAAMSPKLDDKQPLSGKGVFGGSVQFLITKNLSAAGPTWSLQFFKGPGTFGSLSEVNTDKLTVAFAQGPNVGKPMVVTPGIVVLRNPRNPYAYQFLQQLLTSSINSQLNFLNNGIR